MKHPAVSIPFEELMSALEAAGDRGHVRSTTRGNLKLFTYTDACVFERAWDIYTMLARGLIVDVDARAIVALPFIKFFNVGEGISTIPDLPFETFEKLDGSLIIIFYHEGKWKTATKGSLNSEQSNWAAERLLSIDTSKLVPGITYLCEAIYHANRIVVHYDYEGLVLLGGYRRDGTELLADDLHVTAKDLGIRLMGRFHYSSISELMALMPTLPRSSEGFVVRFSNGLRLKIKGDEYCRIHRLISNLTPLSIWEAMLKKDDLEKVRRELPEEFWSDFDQIRGILTNQSVDLINRINDVAMKTVGMSDKEVGLSLDKYPEDIRRFIFPWRKSGGLLVHGRSRQLFFNSFRPTSNVLAGYEPSSSMNRVWSEAA